MCGCCSRAASWISRRNRSPLVALDVYGRAGLGRQNLDDDLPAQPGLLGKEDAAHAAAAQLPEKAVGVAEGGLEALLEVGHGPKRSMAVQTEGL